jgi:hypothetical protein
MVEVVHGLRELVLALGQVGPLGVAALALLVALTAIQKGGTG